MIRYASRLCAILFATLQTLGAEPRSVSGIYPSLAMFNDEGEFGTGAVVPWADRLWVITYGPHKPHGSTDRLYEITPGLTQIIRPESIGAERGVRHRPQQTRRALQRLDDTRVEWHRMDRFRGSEDQTGAAAIQQHGL